MDERTPTQMQSHGNSSRMFKFDSTDFFSCWLQLNETDGKLHDLHDCTSESKGICAGMDSTMTLSMARRSFDVVSEMATFVGETVDPKWCDAKTTPLCVSLLLMFRDVFTHERDRS